MNFTTFCLVFIYYFFLDNFFFTHDIYPHPHPRPTTSTHYLRPGADYLPRPMTFSYTRTRAPREVWERAGERTWVVSVGVVEGVDKCRG